MHTHLKDMSFTHIQSSWKGERVQGGHVQDQETLTVVVEELVFVIVITVVAIALVVSAVEVVAACT